MALRLYGLRVRLGPYRDDRGRGRDMDERKQKRINANAQKRFCVNLIEVMEWEGLQILRVTQIITPCLAG